jgi:hypothetical protein
MFPARQPSKSMNKRNGEWFTTFHGVKFYPLDPHPEEIMIEDIAHALSQICRYGGHTPIFYSVAQHSVLVARNLPAELAFAGLMHDGSEAYLGDVIRPLKMALEDYRVIENYLQSVIFVRFGICLLPADKVTIKAVDNSALATERRDIMRQTPKDIAPHEKAYGEFAEVIEPWTMEKSEIEFLKLYYRITTSPAI